MRLVAVCALAIVLLASTATAGTAARPDVEDERGDGRDRRTDILSAWIQARPEGLRFGMRLVDGDAAHHIYWILLTPQSADTQVAAVVGYGGSGVLRSALTSGDDAGGLDGSRSILARGEFDRAANGGLIDLEATEGATATVEATIPWGAHPAIREGETYEWMVGNTLYEGTWTGMADGAFPDAPFTADLPNPVARAFSDSFPILVPGWTIPLIVAAFTLAGAGAGYGVARRPPRAPPAAPARSIPVETPASAGPRFRAAPPPPGSPKR